MPVTISPHIKDPTTAHITDFLKSSFKKAAIAVPVQTPVVGSGIAINVISAISSNFSNLDLFLVIFLSIKLYTPPKCLLFPSQLKYFIEKYQYKRYR